MTSMEQDRSKEYSEPSLATEQAADVSPEEIEATIAAQGEKSESGQGEEKPAQRMPARYNLYSRINVSLRTMDLIIAAICVAIVVALIIGIFYK